MKFEDTETISDKQAQSRSIITNIVKQLEPKQQEIGTLKSQPVESNDRATRFDRELTALKLQIGHCWIVSFDRSTHYLVPKMDFSNYNKCFEILALLFDGANDSNNFILFKPAIVTIIKANMPKQWKLEQKGYLDPNLVIK